MTIKPIPNDRGNPSTEFGGADNQGNVAIRVIVTVYVDPTDRKLLSAVCCVPGCLFSAADVVRDEIESNLESVSYVRHVSVASTKKELKT